MLTRGEFSVVNKGETYHAYRTPILAALMAPLSEHENLHLWKAEGRIVKGNAIGGLCEQLTIKEEIPLPEVTTTERMKIATSCASWAEGIGEIILGQSRKLDITLSGLLTEWSQRYKWNGQASSDVDLTQWSRKCVWTAEATASIEHKIELQTLLCAEAAQEAARAGVLVKKITWTLGNAMNALGLCLPTDVGKWTARTLLAVIDLPILLPEISEILDRFVEEALPPKKTVKKLIEELSCKKQLSQSSSSKLSLVADESGTTRSKRRRVPPVREAAKRMPAD
jgi:hypothetical protein